MPSPRIERIAADSNVLLAAVSGRAAARVFTAAAPPNVMTTAGAIEEVNEYLPKFAKRYGIGLPELEAALALLPVTVYGESDYAESLAEARRYMAPRDEDDVGLAALALQFKTPIWSNDDDFDELPNTTVYTTAELLAVLDIHSSRV